MVARLAEVRPVPPRRGCKATREAGIVIGADTAVELRREIFGKPRDAAQCATNGSPALSGALTPC